MRFKNLILSAIATVAVVLGLHAALPTYKTLNTTGTAAAPSQIIFPDDANSQIRVVQVYWQSDTNNAQLQFSSGVGAYSESATNLATSSVTNQVNSTNGLVPNSIMVLNHGGAMYSATLSTFNQSTTAGPAGGTNIVLASGGWGVLTSPGDSIYQMSSATLLTVGQTTNSANGDAIYVGNYGRPVLLKLTPALVTNALPVASAHYDSQGQ